MATAGRITSITKDELTVLHISDLHFSHEADEVATTSVHDHNMVASLAEAIANVDADLVVVTGDVTDGGSREQLLRAREFLFGRYPVSGAKEVGLSLNPEKVRIIPGNHDAFNLSNTSGSPTQRVQKSLENFHQIFPEAVCGPNSCSYEWVQADGWNAYVAYVDSCFVGDPHWEDTHPKGVRYLDTTAKGKIALSQFKRLLRWSDEGGSAKPSPRGGLEKIPRQLYVPSLKILVTHHYLFDPPRSKSDRLLQFMDQEKVFRNVALADFDVLWCGHKHDPDFSVHTYGYHMGHEGRWRYCFNCLRRAAGMDSLPLRTLPISEKMPSKHLRNIISILTTWNKPRGPSQTYDRPFAEELEILSMAIDEPRTFEREIQGIIRELKEEGSDCIEESECRELAALFEEEFSHEERVRISRHVRDAGKRLLKQFSKRPFVQALAPSTTKRVKHAEAMRGFFVHKLRSVDDRYLVKVDEYEWRPDHGQFSAKPSREYPIPISRHP